MYASGVVFPLTMVNKVQNEGCSTGLADQRTDLILRLSPAETYLEAFVLPSATTFSHLYVFAAQCGWASSCSRWAWSSSAGTRRAC